MRRLISAAVAAASVLALAVAPSAVAGDVVRGATTITFHVSGCEDCVLQGFTASSYSAPPYNGPKAKVRDGVATMTVPTKQTAGMYFSIDAPEPVLVDAEPLVAFQYKGIAAGTRVTLPQIRKATKASPCWSGTTDSAVDLDVRVRYITLPAFDPDVADPGTTRAPVAWINPTKKADGPFVELYRGLLAVQDVVVCTVG
jgi:hypothetical protein